MNIVREIIVIFCFAMVVLLILPWVANGGNIYFDYVESIIQKESKSVCPIK